MTTTSQRVAASAAIGIMALALGCGAPPAEPEAVADSASIPLASFSQLSGFLPAPDGWTRAEPSGGQIGPPDPPRSSSATTYTRDAARVDLEIVDTARQPEYVEPTQNIAGTEFNRVSDNGFFRGSSVGGFPAIESWNHEAGLAEITVLIVDRFVVHASSAGLDDITALRQFILLVDLEGIAAIEPR